jgi:hypothetical protein
MQKYLQSIFSIFMAIFWHSFTPQEDMRASYNFRFAGDVTNEEEVENEAYLYEFEDDPLGVC